MHRSDKDRARPLAPVSGGAPFRSRRRTRHAGTATALLIALSLLAGGPSASAETPRQADLPPGIPGLYALTLGDGSSGTYRKAPWPLALTQPVVRPDGRDLTGTRRHIRPRPLRDRVQPGFASGRPFTPPGEVRLVNTTCTQTAPGFYTVTALVLSTGGTYLDLGDGRYGITPRPNLGVDATFPTVTQTVTGFGGPYTRGSAPDSTELFWQRSVAPLDYTGAADDSLQLTGRIQVLLNCTPSTAP